MAHPTKTMSVDVCFDVDRIRFLQDFCVWSGLSNRYLEKILGSADENAQAVSDVYGTPPTLHMSIEDM